MLVNDRQYQCPVGDEGILHFDIEGCLMALADRTTANNQKPK